MVTQVADVEALASTVRREVEKYAGEAFQAKQYAIMDEKAHTYVVVYLEDDPKQRPAWVSVMARVVNDYVVIEEDRSLDKPLYEALIVNGGIPREKIVLAYQGETLPENPT